MKICLARGAAPSCSQRQFAANAAPRRCRDAVVGAGRFSANGDVTKSPAMLFL
jgi:hypothetical protein